MRLKTPTASSSMTVIIGYRAVATSAYCPGCGLPSNDKPSWRLAPYAFITTTSHLGVTSRLMLLCSECGEKFSKILFGLIQNECRGDRGDFTIAPSNPPANDQPIRFQVCEICETEPAVIEEIEMVVEDAQVIEEGAAFPTFSV